MKKKKVQKFQLNTQDDVLFVGAIGLVIFSLYAWNGGIKCGALGLQIQGIYKEDLVDERESGDCKGGVVMLERQ